MLGKICLNRVYCYCYPLHNKVGWKGKVAEAAGSQLWSLMPHGVFECLMTRCPALWGSYLSNDNMMVLFVSLFFICKMNLGIFFSVDTHWFVPLKSAIIFLGPLHKQNLFHPRLMCGEMTAYLLSAVLLRFHHSVLMVFLPVFKKAVMGNQAFFPS